MFWTSLGSLVMASIGLYTLNNNNDDEVIRAGREIPDNINENSLDMNMNISKVRILKCFIADMSSVTASLYWLTFDAYI